MPKIKVRSSPFQQNAGTSGQLKSCTTFCPTTWFHDELPSVPTGGQLRTFYTIQWESEQCTGEGPGYPPRCLTVAFGARIPRQNTGYIAWFITHVGKIVSSWLLYFLTVPIHSRNGIDSDRKHLPCQQRCGQCATYSVLHWEQQAPDVQASPQCWQ